MRKRNLLGLVIAWLVVFAMFTWKTNGGFATVDNLSMLFRQGTIVSFAALGATLVIIGGGIDLSVGSVVAFVTVLIAWLLRKGWDPSLAALGGIIGGLLWGAINGGLAVRLKVGAFIVTLGTLLAARGVAKGLANEQKIDAPLTYLKDLLARLAPNQAWMGVPPGVWLMLALAGVTAWTLGRTRYGRQLVALGGNERAARYSGVPVDRVRLLTYTLAGGFAGLAGLAQFSRLTVGDPTVAAGLELDAIAAAVIGGASLSGGEGSVAGALLGALIMATIRAGSSQAGIPNWVQEIVTGIIIVTAVALDRWRASRLPV